MLFKLDLAGSPPFRLLVEWWWPFNLFVFDELISFRICDLSSSDRFCSWFILCEYNNYLWKSILMIVSFQLKYYSTFYDSIRLRCALRPLDVDIRWTFYVDRDRTVLFDPRIDRYKSLFALDSLLVVVWRSLNNIS